MSYMYGTIFLVQLVNDTLPSAISPNIASQDYLAMLSIKVILQYLPSIKSIRKCRKIFRTISETLVDYLIGKMNQWDQLLYEIMGRHQIYLQNLVISVINEKRLHPFIISTSVILEVETSDKQVDGVMSTIAGCRKRLQQWAETLENAHPSYQHNITYPSSINIGRLGSGGTLA